MKFLYRILLIGLVVLVPVAAFAQTVGSITGTIKSEGNPLPGVTVTVASSSMQGSRTAATDGNGNYNIPALPPGVYSVRFALAGMQDVSRQTKVALSQTTRVDADLKLSSVTEAITVTATSPATAAIETTQISANLPAKLMEQLPVGRSLQAAVSMAPGVNENGPNTGAFSISGAPAYESNYIINGVTVNENLRGQPLNLFIEDAIQETTVLTGAISAEYGRFTGGVVSAITKSGGNQFSGSLRGSLSNPSWTSKSAYAGQPDNLDQLSKVYEATLGGRIIRDRLWFFGAGRDSNITSQQFLFQSATPYNPGIKTTRYEGKLTGQITSKHSLVGSYLEEKVDTAPYCFLDLCYESMSINQGGIHRPKNFKTFNYNGILTSSLIVEGNWSRKIHRFSGDGGPVGDFAHASYAYDLNTGAFFAAPVFCKTCGRSEERNNKSWDAKATYYLATKATGTHSVSAGYQNWAEQRIADNYQSGSNYSMYVYNTPVVDTSGVAHPYLSAGDLINYTPILFLTKGSDFATNSFFVNDKWDMNSHLSFNLGVRYDKNAGQNSRGAEVAKDSAISPRLGLTYDVGGNSRYRLNASYSKYVARIAETIGGSGSPAGNPVYFQYLYGGPDINTPAGGPLDTVGAFQQVWNWFSAQCADPANPGSAGCKDIFNAGGVPGFNKSIVGSLKSPSVTETTVGIGSLIGSGFVRADVVHRDWNDFYSIFVDQSTGNVTDQFGNTLDFQAIQNSDRFKRKYDALELQGQYPLMQHLNLGAMYTYAKLKGNVLAETGGSGPVLDLSQTYPEYRAFAANNPVGYLPSDQTHRGRFWASFNLPTALGTLNLSALERLDSGTPYSMVTTLNTRGFVTNPGYVSPPSGVNYYFSKRGGLRWDTTYATDFAVQYELPIWKSHVFAHADLLNAFNEQAQINGDTTILSNKNASCKQASGARCAAFNPFTETPQLGVHYQPGPIFGQARTALDFQQPRTYRFTLGVKF